MLNGKKIIAVLPAYNAEKTLVKTIKDIPFGLVDEILLTDDHSTDRTVEIANQIPILTTLVHTRNMGYGANQKTCYDEALKRGGDVVVMLHPDYQYDPRLVLAMAAPIAYGVYDIMLGSRILGGKAMAGGMPPLKYFMNRVTTFIWNIAYRQKLSEFHSGYRAYSRKVLETIPYHQNSNNFVFDHQMLAQMFFHGFGVGEVSCPTRYFAEASSIDLKNGSIYLLECFRTTVEYWFHRIGLRKSPLFAPNPAAP